VCECWDEDQDDKRWEEVNGWPHVQCEWKNTIRALWGEEEDEAEGRRRLGAARSSRGTVGGGERRASATSDSRPLRRRLEDGVEDAEDGGTESSYYQQPAEASPLDRHWCRRGHQIGEDFGWAFAIKLVFGPATANDDLFSLEAIQGVCQFDDMVRSRPGFLNGCEVFNSNGECCPSRSLGHVVAQLANKTACADVTAEDVAYAKSLAQTCAPAFFGGQLGLCDDPAQPWGCDNLEGPRTICHADNAIVDLFTHLVDKDFLNPYAASAADANAVSLVRLGVPAVDWIDPEWLIALHDEQLYELLEEPQPGGVVLLGYDVGVRFEIFTSLLTKEGILVGFGFLCIFCVMWAYSGSVFMTGLSFIQIFFSIAVAYFLYNVVLWRPFFPFLNLVSLFIVIGIGADDVFVFIESTNTVVRNSPPDRPIEDILTEVLMDAGVATLVTSATTAGAFFSSAVSPIVSLKCFGLFCGLVVLADWFLMITFMPSLIAYYRKNVLGSACATGPALCTHRFCDKAPAQRKLDGGGDVASAWLGVAFASGFRKYVTPGRRKTALVVAFVCLAGGFGRRAPEMATRFPTAEEMQLLMAEHPFEIYVQDLKNRFADASSGGGTRSGRFVFGAAPVDNGDHWSADDRGSIQLSVPAADFYSKEAQVFFRDLPSVARDAEWYKPHADWPWAYSNATAPGAEFWPDTLVGILEQSMTMPCEGRDNDAGGVAGVSAECCATGLEFPYAPDVFRTCLRDLASVFPVFWTPESVQFDPDTGDIRMWHQSFDTVFEDTRDYQGGKEFYDVMTAFGEAHVKAAAPGALADGFFYGGSLWHYSLQSSIGKSAVDSATVASIIAGVVLVGMTQNFIVAFFATGTILAIIATLTGILVTAGWELDVIQSVIFSCAIGMAVDFVAHLGHAYRSAMFKAEGTDGTPEDLVADAMGAMGPSISAAALSTFIAGAWMLGSQTQFYIYFGQFMTLVQVLSWSFAVLCFMPIVAHIPVKHMRAAEIGPMLFGAASKGGAATKAQELVAVERGSDAAVA